MRIGWVECGVKERIYLTRCFKCLEYSHKTRDCTAKVDRSDECYKCGSKGHRSKECKNEEKCTKCNVAGHRAEKCNVAGHRADQIKCPYFRKMVEQKRKENIESMSSGRRGHKGNTHDS
ncbi:Zinc knuckle [Popillia japonica]|uniref:Zinc knuckle n=1 Tax=Popillia japonica TaxID=7064 RepID=A0AAW1IBH9_POPJA